MVTAKGKQGLLDLIERLGNRLPDPAVLFVIALVLTWLSSLLLAGTTFVVPATTGPETRQVVSQLTGTALAQFLADMVKTFSSFPPLGLVIVALLGVGVAEQSGFIRAALKQLLRVTPRSLLTPMLLLVAILSHSAADAGFVVVIPLGGVIFHAAGRHPLAGIAAAFAGVSGGFSANPIPSGLDPLLQGFTQGAAQIIDPARQVSPLCNWAFMGASTLLIIGAGWYLTDRVIEPRLARVPLDEGIEAPPTHDTTPAERRGLNAALAATSLALVLLVVAIWPRTSPLRGPAGELTSFQTPLMQAIIPLIFLLFLLPGVVHGFVSGTFRSSRDVIRAMSTTMTTMADYIVMVFFAALFIYAFNKSQLGALLAVKGASGLRALQLPAPVTVTGFILISSAVNILIGSASAKWALLAPVFVPMLMQVGLSPELVQAAYRVGDSSSNVITPLNAYFPLILSFCHRYVKSTRIGTVTSLMLPYAGVFLVAWTAFLMAFWLLGAPLGVHGVYRYP